jgi:CRP-like cAMP-binding protein
MDIFTYPQGTVLYNFGEVPSGIYFLIEGDVSITFYKKEFTLNTGSFGEWSLFSLPSQEKVLVSSKEATFYVFRPDEVLQSRDFEKILKKFISSIAKRLMFINSELAQCQEIPEYVGPDRLRFFKRTHPNAIRFDEKIFQDISLMKHLFVKGEYKEAFNISVKLLSEVLVKDLKKEITIWYTLLTLILDPEHAHLHFKRLDPKEYGDHLSYQYLSTFFNGGQAREIVELYTKAGFYIPTHTLLTIEGEPATQGFLILRGYLKAVKLYEDKEILLSLVKPGEFVGESAILENKTRMITLYSISPVELIPITRENVEKATEKNPDFVLKICESQLKRIKQVKSLIELKSNPNSIQRVVLAINYLQELLEKTRINVRDISNIANSPLEIVITELNRQGFKVSVDGSVSV